MRTETILVVGGTGMLGEPVTRRLLRDGFGVRVLTRDVERASAVLGPDVEVLAGEIDDAAAIERALIGCTGVHISLSAGPDPTKIDRIEHRGTARLAALVARHGIARLTYLSHGLADDASVIPEHRAKFQAEQAIHRSGVAYTIFKPSYFMETLPRHIRGKLAIVMGRQPHPVHMVAADDFAAMVSRSFRTAEAMNRSFYVHGPEAITLPDGLRLYCALVEPGKRVVAAPLAVKSIADRLVMHGKLQGTLRLMEVMERMGERGDASETDRVLGAATTTLRQWCEAQRAQASSNAR